jgi:hypothetical protein
MKSDSILLLRTDKSPRPERAGIMVAAPPEGKCLLEKDAWVHGCFALTAEDLARMPMEQWFRCLALSGISKGDQFPYLADILGEQVVFPEEIQVNELKDGAKLTSIAFNVQIAKTLGLPSRPESYYIQAFCLGYRSNLFELICS